MPPVPADHPSARRRVLALVAPGVVASGLLVRLVGAGPASTLAGDALYAALVYVLVALVAPRARATTVGTVAWVLCVLVELAQAVGLARAVVDLWEPARWVLGTTFHAPDLLVYAVGACAAAAVDAAVTRPRSGGPAPTSAGTPARPRRRPLRSPAPARRP